MSASVGTVLVTGASGFVGREVCVQAAKAGMLVRAAVRGVGGGASLFLTENVQKVSIADLSCQIDWSDALADCRAVVHCAARVHVMAESAADPLGAFRTINVEGTLQLARQAAAAGVRRFVYVSSIKVNGELTPPGVPFGADDAPMPMDAYGISKMEAEQELLKLAVQTDMDVVIIRPPLVYGPGVKANFASMMRWLRRGVPLPLGAIHNMRSLVALGNLVDLIMLCLTHASATNQIFLVSDGEDVSTTELLRRMGRAMGKSARLLPVPQRAIELTSVLLCKQAIAQRLCGTLQVDITKTKQLLGWEPPISLDQGLKMTAQGVSV